MVLVMLCVWRGWCVCWLEPRAWAVWKRAVGGCVARSYIHTGSAYTAAALLCTMLLLGLVSSCQRSLLCCAVLITYCCPPTPPHTTIHPRTDSFASLAQLPHSHVCHTYSLSNLTYCIAFSLLLQADSIAHLSSSSNCSVRLPRFLTALCHCSHHAQRHRCRLR